MNERARRQIRILRAMLKDPKRNWDCYHNRRVELDIQACQTYLRNTERNDERNGDR